MLSTVPLNAVKLNAKPLNIILHKTSLSSLLFFSILLGVFFNTAANAGQTKLAYSADSSNPYLAALPQWADTLQNYVDQQGRIDFYALAKQPASLAAFVEAIAAVSPASHPGLFPNRAAVLAYHANAYNALAMQGVLERDIPKNFSSLVKRASFFKFRSVVIGGKKTNLYDYENKVIRPLGEARMHFVLNCMVRDCPRLPQQTFQAETLEQDLQAASVEFFNKDKHIRVDPAQQKVYLSGIMKFYTKDYVASGKNQDLIAYVNQFTNTPIPEEYRVKFIKYDWTVNQQPK